MKKLGESLIAILWAALMIWGEFGGLYHTFTRHKDQFWLAVFVPPVSWYRSVEFFWHDEYSGKKWETTKKADVQTIFYLLQTSHQKDADRAKLSEEIEGFKKKISKYPKDNKAIIKTIFDDYVQYELALYDDFIEMLSRFAASDAISGFKSDKTKELELKLQQYGLKEYTDVSSEMMDKFQKALESNNNESERQKMQPSLEKLKSLLDQKKKAALADMQEVSKKIFE
jgi:hypothetical protein